VAVSVSTSTSVRILFNCRHQQGHLFAILHRFEGRAQGHLGLAITHVAADQAIHRLRLLHIGLHGADGAQLILSLKVRERCLQFVLPWRVGAEGEAGRELAPGVQFQQFARHGQRGLFRLRADLAPIRRAQAVDVRRVIVRPDVFAQAIGLVDGDVQLIAAGIRDLQVFILDAFEREFDQTLKDADAVIDVYHVIAGLQIGEELFRRDGFGLAAPPRLWPRPAEDLRVGDEVQRPQADRPALAFVARKDAAQRPAFVQQALHEDQRARLGPIGHTLHRRAQMITLGP
jgi:hypothetical protein